MHSVAKEQKNSKGGKKNKNRKKMKGGTFWRQKKFRKKSRTVPKKIERGDSLVPSGFVGYLEKVQNQKVDSLVPSGFVGYLEKVKNEKGDPLH